MHDFVDEGLRPMLAAAGLDSFEALWGLETPWFEPPNRRRGGWSGVVRLTLSGDAGGERALFVKRQEDHVRRSWCHPIVGQPTLAAEMQSILALGRFGVPTLRPVYYAQRHVEGRWRAILATEELAGYRSLDAWIADWRERGWRRFRAERDAVSVAAAETIRQLHRHGWVHGALYPKHLFVRFEGNGRADVRLIDLETTRRAGTRSRALRRDLDSLNRRTPCFSRSERLRFLLRYLGVSRLASAGRRQWRYLVRRRVERGRRPANDC